MALCKRAGLMSGTTTTDDLRDAVIRAIEAKTDLRAVKEILDVTRAPNMRQDSGFQVLVSQRNTDGLRDKPGRVTQVESEIEITCAYRLSPRDHTIAMSASNADVDTIRAELIADLRPPMELTHLTWRDVDRPTLHSNGEWMYRRIVLVTWWHLGIAS